MPAFSRVTPLDHAFHSLFSLADSHHPEARRGRRLFKYQDLRGGGRVDGTSDQRHRFLAFLTKTGGGDRMTGNRIWEHEVVENERLVKNITAKNEDYSRWYIDVIRKAELADYAPIKGMMIIRPYGYTLWERIRDQIENWLQDQRGGHKLPEPPPHGRKVLRPDIIRDLKLPQHGLTVLPFESTLTRRLDNLNAALRSLSGMHHAMTRLSQQELSAFAQEIERSHPYVKAIVQLRQIADAERGPYEAEMREAGFPTFSLRTFTSDGSLSESPNKVQYMVAHAVEPLDPALARYLGLDVYSSPLLQNAIARAIAEGRTIACTTIGPQGPDQGFRAYGPTEFVEYAGAQAELARKP